MHSDCGTGAVGEVTPAEKKCFSSDAGAVQDMSQDEAGEEERKVEAAPRAESAGKEPEKALGFFLALSLCVPSFALNLANVSSWRPVGFQWARNEQ